MSLKNIDRNEELVALRDGNPLKYTFGFLAEKYRITKATAYEIYVREKARHNHKKSKESLVLKKKYPALAR